MDAELIRYDVDRTRAAVTVCEESVHIFQHLTETDDTQAEPADKELQTKVEEADEIDKIVFAGFSQYHNKGITRYASGKTDEAITHRRGPGGFINAVFENDRLVELEVPNQMLLENGDIKVSNNHEGGLLCLLCSCRFCFFIDFGLVPRLGPRTVRTALFHGSSLVRSARFGFTAQASYGSVSRLRPRTVCTIRLHGSGLERFARFGFTGYDALGPATTRYDPQVGVSSAPLQPPRSARKNTDPLRPVATRGDPLRPDTTRRASVVCPPQSAPIRK